ncbi:hypothetical protein ACH4UY_04985 [Streptomyces longwoodensis]|uniref:hypothetical protein n=1 Tax=Streptomyces longwoodensis TaxID=68231 RepID=UPI0037AB02CB
MAFPEDPLGLRRELRVGTEWVAVPTYTRDPITHSRGRPVRANSADPAEATITIKNVDGKYTPRNPESPYYGLIGRNTPIRATIPGGDDMHLALNGGIGRATTPDTNALDITGSIDVRWEINLDNLSQSQGTILGGKWMPAGNQCSWLMRIDSARRPVFRRSLTGAVLSESYTSDNPIPTTVTGRVAVRATWNAATGQYVYYWAPSIAGPWTQIGISITTSASALVATTAPLTIGDIDQVTSYARPDGAIYKFELRNGINGTVVCSVDFTAQTSGATSFTDSTGLVWTLAGTAELNDRVVRFNLEVPAWPPQWAPSEKDAWTSIAAAGLLRRLGQGSRTLDSTLRRRIPSGRPIAYWPCEDGGNATQLASATSGVRPLSMSGLQLAADDSLAGSSALPTMRTGSAITGTVPPPSDLTQWHTEFVFKTPGAGPATPRTLLQWTGTGTVRRWELKLKNLGAEVYGYDADDNTVTQSLVNLTGAGVFGVWCRWRLYAVQNGSNVDWTVQWVPIGAPSSVFTTTSFAGTVGRIDRIVAPAGGLHSDLDGTAIGHISVFTQAGTTIYNFADLGFDGETAAARIQRLCAEEGVPVTVVGDPAGTQRMGPQRPSAFLELLRDAAEADGGVFGETRSRRELWYRTRADLYNQVPKLILDYAAKKVAPPLEPVEDDQPRNSWEVTREGGSSAVASLDTGPMSTQEPPAGIGYYPDSKTLNLYSDDQPEQIAGWLLHLTTWNEASYPAVTLRLHRHPEFIRTVLGLEVGDKIRIINLPKAFVSAGSVELLVDGWEETLLPRTWEITFNCSPAGPWNVAALAYREDFEDTTYEITYTNGGALPWARSQLHYNSGTWSLRSGAISNNQTSDFIVDVPPLMTQLKFWYWTSSEGPDIGDIFPGDRLLVVVDGVQVLRAQGTTPWTQAIIDVSGKSKVTFRYAKDNSASGGEDAVHIDDIEFTGAAATRADTDGSVLVNPVSATDTALLVATTPLDAPIWTKDPIEFPFAVTAGGEEMTAKAISSWVLDEFSSRSAAGGWSQADTTGQMWQVVGGTVATDFAVSGGTGQHILTTTNASRRCGLVFTYPDADVVVSLTTSVAATGGSLYGGPLVRYVDSDNLYMARVEFTTAGAILLDLRKRTGGTESSLATFATGLTHTPGTFVRARLQARGSVLRAKVWAPGTPEPDWQITTTDTSVTTSNFVGCRSITAASNTNTNPVIRYDSFEVLNPQTFTVSRSANGVTKAQAAGTAVQLAKPMTIAL